MKEFWKKHKVAILITGGIFLLLYLYYAYEQSQAASTSAATTANNDALASQLAGLAATQTPLIAGGGGGISASVPSASNLPDYTDTASTTTQSPSTAASGLPNNSVGTAIIASMAPTVPTPASTGNAPNPYSTGGGAASASSINANLQALGQQAEGNAYGQYALPGGTLIPGVPVVTPGSLGGSVLVAGLAPGQAGYSAALQGQIALEQAQGEDATSLMQQLAQYGGEQYPTGTTETNTTPAGSGGAGSGLSSSYTPPVQPLNPNPQPVSVTPEPVVLKPIGPAASNPVAATAPIGVLALTTPKTTGVIPVRPLTYVS